MPDLLPLTRSDLLPEDAYAAANERSPHAVTHFEDALAAHCGRRHAIACASGPGAVFAALAGLRIGAGDEVICSALVPGGTLLALATLGARPVFVDVSPSMLVADPEAVVAAFSPRTRAVVAAVGVAGQVGIDAVAAAARRLEVPLIEDGGHAFGSSCAGRLLGATGRASTFDFGHGAPLSTLCGGVMLTDDDRLADAVRRTLASDAAGLTPLGAPMAPFAAGLGLSQLRRLDGILARRRELAECYLRGLLENPDLVLPDLGAEETHAWPMFWARLSTDYSGKSRELITGHLARHGIETAPALHPAHRSPLASLGVAPQGAKGSIGLPVAESLARRTLRLPLFNQMTEAQIEQVCHSLTEAMLLARRESSDWPEGDDVKI